MFILVADDDDNIALALKTMIVRKIPGASVVCVSDGLQAFEIYKSKNIDLILSDWNMPLMSGKDLLAEIRFNHNDQLTPFLMLTARADIDSVREAISSGVTEYIAKPFEKKSLLEKICSLLKERENEQAIDDVSDKNDNEIKEKIIDILKVRLKKGYIKFPVLPEVAFKAVDVITSDNVSMIDVAAIVKVDAALSAKVLSLANSSYYRSQQSIETLEEAMARIGSRETLNAVLIYAMKELFRDEDKTYGAYLRHLWESALLTASLARELGKITHYQVPDKLYFIGMFHDIGKLVILPVLMELKAARGGITDEVVTDVMQVLGKEVGVELLKRWHFSDLFLNAVKLQCEYAELASANDEALLIVMASYLGHQHMGDDLAKYDINIIALLQNQLGLTDQCIATATKEAIRITRETKDLLLSPNN